MLIMPAMLPADEQSADSSFMGLVVLATHVNIKFKMREL